MKASELRASILQEAICGRLVPQIAEEGTAAELLKEIKAERAELVKAGKIKKERALPEITEEEKPFAIPESWEWVRLGDIGFWKAGGTPSRVHPEYYNNGTIPWLKSGDLNDEIISSSEEKITQEAIENSSAKINSIGSVIIAMYGATIGKTGILSIEATTNQACCACNVYSGVDNKLLQLFLISQKKNLIELGWGSAQPNISREKIVSYLFPLPPLAEQHRIVAKIEELMPLIDAYGKEETALSSLDKSFPEQIRKSILQEAVCGRLVPQIAEEGTAAELLKEIKEERAELVKAGKIKKERALPEISEEEKPFAIPESWEWVRLGTIIHLLSGRDLEPDAYSDKEIGLPYLTGASNILDGKICIERWTNKPQVIARKGDLLLSCKGTVGKTVVLEFDEIHIARQIMSLRKITGLDINYLKIFIDTSINKLEGVAKSMIPGISRDNILELCFPLPPLAEQRRIVAKIEELMKIVDTLKE